MSVSIIASLIPRAHGVRRAARHVFPRNKRTGVAAHRTTVVDSARSLNSGIISAVPARRVARKNGFTVGLQCKQSPECAHPRVIHAFASLHAPAMPQSLSLSLSLTLSSLSLVGSRYFSGTRSAM